MKPGTWYKAFGVADSADLPAEEEETYYHVVSRRGDELQIEEYRYLPTLKRLRRTSPAPRTVSVKTWMEQQVKNNIYELQKEDLPFYLTI
ncbi:MAG: hypothetical protein K9L68_01100 [Spirochaetales bacterium]|nr:hypothetical protein [Spirochaetales bacterium]MCF7937173.1 hypothetical protein [Spirochaetales bacterium]